MYMDILMMFEGIDTQEFQLFLDLILLQGSTSTHLKRNNQTTTYWQLTVEGCNAQDFQLFLNLFLSKDKCVHILKEKESDHHTLMGVT